VPASTVPRQSQWEHFSHEADLGVRGRGRTIAEAFEQTATALAAAVVDPGTVRATQTADIHCEAPDSELLLVDWLNAIIYEMATRHLCFARFNVEIDGTKLSGRAVGEPFDAARHAAGVEPKGATYTALRVAPEPDGSWVAQCIVDV
jgi:tRNA nucleotidyltransferase (CCA-adding enzyme)